MRLHIRFIGGPHDGKTLPVPSPVTIGMEISVRPEEPYLPCALYVLEDDGSFHYTEAENVVHPSDELQCCPTGT